jgi:hypothetical protein
LTNFTPDVAAKGTIAVPEVGLQVARGLADIHPPGAGRVMVANFTGVYGVLKRQNIVHDF